MIMKIKTNILKKVLTLSIHEHVPLKVPKVAKRSQSRNASTAVLIQAPASFLTFLA
jgi:hypothetical protein